MKGDDKGSLKLLIGLMFFITFMALSSAGITGVKEEYHLPIRIAFITVATMFARLAINGITQFSHSLTGGTSSVCRTPLREGKGTGRVFFLEEGKALILVAFFVCVTMIIGGVIAVLKTTPPTEPVLRMSLATPVVASITAFALIIVTNGLGRQEGEWKNRGRGAGRG